MTKTYPESQIYWLSIDHHICGVVVEDCWNIFTRKCICGVTDEKTSFTDSSGSDKEGKERRKKLSHQQQKWQITQQLTVFLFAFMIHCVIELN